ncbi:MAG: hypothetical protein ACREB3_11780, partial [Burkholderiales bacterium]
RHHRLRRATVHALAAFFTLTAAVVPASSADSPLDLAALAANPLELAKSYTKEVSVKDYKGTRKVLISMAAVTFKLESNAFTKATDVLGGMHTGTASTAMSMSLGGVSKEALQQIADAFHDQLAAEFKALGAEVIEPSVVKASPKFAALAAMNDESHRQPTLSKAWNGHVITMTGYGMPLVGTGLSGIGGPARTMMALGMSFGENVTVVYANVMVDFASMTGSGGLLAKSSSLSGKPLLSVPFVTACGFFRGYYGGAVGFTKPIISPVDYSTAVTESSNVRNTDWFSGSTASRSAYAVQADEAKYKAAVGDLLKAVSVMFTARIREKAK